MRLIVKNGEPRAWREYRNTPGVDFEAIPELKAALLEEQGHLCCYCMSRIKINKMKVEHYVPRRHEHLKMVYTNLFAACTGDYCPDKHCDTRKEDAELSIHPTDPRTNCETIVGYRLNGKLTYSDSYQKDIEETTTFGVIAEKALQKEDFSNLQNDIIALNKIQINTSILFIESRAKKLFKIWANTIKKKGTTPKKRATWLMIFRNYLYFALFIVSPVVLTIYTILFRPLTLGQIKRKKEYFCSVKLNENG